MSPRKGSASPDDVEQLEAHTLMQMLTLVGSRLIEADSVGLTEEEGAAENLGEARSPDEQEANQAAATGTDTGPIASSSFAPAVGPSRKAPLQLRSFGIQSQLTEEQSTPRGGQTPLAASLGSIRTLHRPERPHSRLQNSIVRPVVHAASAAQQEETTEDNSGDSSGSSSDSDGSAADPQHKDADALSSSLHQLSVQDTTSDRAAQLSAKIRSIFGLADDEQVRSCFSCWLYRSVLLQGHLYLTSSHLLFYAYLPTREDKIIKAGSLRKKTRRTYRFTRHWAVLRGRALSWYDSQHDPYFPRDHIDVRDMTEVRKSKGNPRHFRIVTPYRTFLFGVDTEQSRDDWIEVLRKAAFRAQNEGESVRIGVPYEAIVDIDATSADGLSPSADMVSVQVVDRQSSEFVLDEYCFLHFAPGEQEVFTSQMRDSLAAQASYDPSIDRTSSSPSSLSSIRDTTSRIHHSGVKVPVEEAAKMAGVDPRKEKGVSSERSASSTAAATAIAIPGASESRDDPASADDFASGTPRPTTALSGPTFDVSGYPPPSLSLSPPSSTVDSRRRSWNVPRWMRTTPAQWIPKMNGNIARDALGAVAAGQRSLIRPVTEVWSTLPPLPLDSIRTSNAEPAAPLPSAEQDLSASQCSGFSMLDPQSEDEEAHQTPMGPQQSEEWFRKMFALPSGEELLHQMDAYLYRVLPIAGRLWLSNRHVCFLSSNIAAKTLGRTKMILPLAEVVSCARHKALHFGHHGLVLAIRGYEELFFEFTTRGSRDECLRLLESSIDASNQHTGAEGLPQAFAAAETERSDAIVLTDLIEPSPNTVSDLAGSTSSLGSASAQSSAPSQSSDSNISLLCFKPPQSLQFTLLTIGSRGDVQPFLSLAKGLVNDGHRVCIATHAEFGPWIQQHGVEFREIGGDPAELMRICVDNGTFTVSFLREGVTKFRGWLDDLLVSCWRACQGSDVIIESPNALAGIHIAEALKIPYFRAFTMPWSRTRAYPQAFAVPQKRAGGSYNYTSYVIFDSVLWRASSGQINRWRKSDLGLSPTSYDQMEQHKVPYLYSFSTCVVPKPIDWPDWIHITGFWFLDDPEASRTKTWTPPEDLVRFIDQARARGRKIVYIGWGSITVPDAAATTRCVVEAVRQSGVSAILSKGWSERLAAKRDQRGASTGEVATSRDLNSGLGFDAEISSSDQIFRVESVPHDWLFPLIDAACHHGGAGTIGASLRAGLPTIVKPWFGDQFFWGQQVESLGVGSLVRELTVPNLTNALVQATQNAKQIERARLLGERVRAEDGVKEAIRAIYADLEYAASLTQWRAAKSASVLGATMQRSPPMSSAGAQGAARKHRSRASSSTGGSEDWSVVSDSNNHSGSGQSRRGSDS